MFTYIVRELQIQLIIRELGGDGSEQGLVPADSIREKAIRLLYALEEAAKHTATVDFDSNRGSEIA